MHPDNFIERRTAANGSLRLFSIYADYPASVLAKWATGTITKLAGKRWKSSTEMWTVNFLGASGSIGKMILEGAADADVLIIAMSSLEQRETGLMQWLDSLAAEKNNRLVPGLLVGLLGDEENKAQELKWTVKQFIHCAQQTNRDFIWHWMERNAMNDSDWLTEGVETMLSRKQFACDEVVFQETIHA
ncbi:MAG: hypothetical protein ABR955_14295 [Verrucomicrobiota bacterium]|jgi:hypothetical protein